MSSSGERSGGVGGPGTATSGGRELSREERDVPNGGDLDAPDRRDREAPSREDRASTVDPVRPRTKAAQREATTAALVDAARELFAGRGYANVGTEEIVQQAGVTRGALYHHFRGGKEELFRAVVVQISAETAGRVREVARANDDPWNALIHGIDAFLDACALPDVQRILLVDGPAVLGWDVWRAVGNEMGQTVHRWLEGLRVPVR